jgi:hypothetical protein
MGIDPLASTYKWLERAVNRLKTKETTGWYQSSSEATTSPQNESSLAILNEAYCELLLWNPKYPFPEVIISLNMNINEYSFVIDIKLR